MEGRAVVLAWKQRVPEDGICAEIVPGERDAVQPDVPVETAARRIEDGQDSDDRQLGYHAPFGQPTDTNRPFCGAVYTVAKGRRKSPSGDVTCVRCKRVLKQAAKNALV